jgi:hypoxanthine phosphoribosyltransferase
LQHLNARPNKNMIEINSGNGYDVAQFVLPSHYKDDLESVLIPYGLVQDRIEKLAHDIAATVTKPLVACCVLKGAHEFFADLTRHLKKLRNTNGETIPLSVEVLDSINSSLLR